MHYQSDGVAFDAAGVAAERILAEVHAAGRHAVVMERALDRAPACAVYTVEVGAVVAKYLLD